MFPAVETRTADGAEGRPRRVADLVFAPVHAGSLDGAPHVGEAAAEGRAVRIGVWRTGPRLRARFRATSCASLIAYAEVACAALEAGRPPPDAGALRALVAGVHPIHERHAELVAAALRAALPEEDA